MSPYVSRDASNQSVGGYALSAFGNPCAVAAAAAWVRQVRLSFFFHAQEGTILRIAHLTDRTAREENSAEQPAGNMNTFSSFEMSFFDMGIRYLAGIDEVGRGPLAGPVVAAAVVMPPGTVIEEIEDSKRLSPAKRARLAREISGRAMCVGIGTAGPEEIDELNILRASILAMHRAIDGLPIRPDLLLVDGNRFEHSTLAFRTVIHGDAHCFSIAAASIVAKVHRDALMEKLDDMYPQYGFRRHRGYPTAAHIEALRLHGPSPVHRKSFTVRALLPPGGK